MHSHAGAWERVVGWVLNPPSVPAGFQAKSNPAVRMLLIFILSCAPQAHEGLP